MPGPPQGRHSKPAIFNTDQGSQFTSTAFTAALLREKITISMDGKGCCRDNVFVERLWRSVKYEEVYLNAYASVHEARAASASTTPSGRTPRWAAARPTRYTSNNRFSRHDQQAAIHLSEPRACLDKPSYLSSVPSLLSWAHETAQTGG
jgi:transposase InsO family protein